MTADEQPAELPSQTRAWLRLVAVCLASWSVGFLLRVGAGLSGGHDGRPLYLLGAVLSTGPLVLTALVTELPPLRLTAVVLAVVTSAFWLVGLHDFLASPGLRW